MEKLPKIIKEKSFEDLYNLGKKVDKKEFWDLIMPILKEKSKTEMSPTSLKEFFLNIDKPYRLFEFVDSIHFKDFHDLMSFEKHFGYISVEYLAEKIDEFELKKQKINYKRLILAKTKLLPYFGYKLEFKNFAEMVFFCVDSGDHNFWEYFSNKFSLRIRDFTPDFLEDLYIKSKESHYILDLIYRYGKFKLEEFKEFIKKFKTINLEGVVVSRKILPWKDALAFAKEKNSKVAWTALYRTYVESPLEDWIEICIKYDEEYLWQMCEDRINKALPLMSPERKIRIVVNSKTGNFGFAQYPVNNLQQYIGSLPSKEFDSLVKSVKSLSVLKDIHEIRQISERILFEVADDNHKFKEWISPLIPSIWRGMTPKEARELVEDGLWWNAKPEVIKYVILSETELIEMYLDEEYKDYKGLIEERLNSKK